MKINKILCKYTISLMLVLDLCEISHCKDINEDMQSYRDLCIYNSVENTDSYQIQNIHRHKQLESNHLISDSLGRSKKYKNALQRDHTFEEPTKLQMLLNGIKHLFKDSSNIIYALLSILTFMISLGFDIALPLSKIIYDIGAKIIGLIIGLGTILFNIIAFIIKSMRKLGGKDGGGGDGDDGGDDKPPKNNQHKKNKPKDDNAMDKGHENDDERKKDDMHDNHNNGEENHIAEQDHTTIHKSELSEPNKNINTTTNEDINGASYSKYRDSEHISKPIATKHSSTDHDQVESVQVDWNNRYVYSNVSGSNINIQSIQDLMQNDIYPLNSIRRALNDFTRRPAANILAFFSMIVHPKLALGGLI